MTTTRQMEAYYSRISGESQNSRIEMLELEEMPMSLGRQGPGIFKLSGAPKVENSDTRQQGWVCDLVSRAWLGLRVTSTSFCCLEGSGDAKRWGQGNSRQDPGRGRRVTQGCGKNVGHPLSSWGRPLVTLFFFFKGFKIKLHLTLKEQVITSKTQ